MPFSLIWRLFCYQLQRLHQFAAFSSPHYGVFSTGIKDTYMFSEFSFLVDIFVDQFILYFNQLIIVLLSFSEQRLLCLLKSLLIIFGYVKLEQVVS